MGAQQHRAGPPPAGSRAEARSQGFAILGTAAVLVLAKEQPLIPASAPLLAALRDQGYFLSDAAAPLLPHERGVEIWLAGQPGGSVQSDLSGLVQEAPARTACTGWGGGGHGCRCRSCTASSARTSGPVLP
jgi:hypothetical protein